MSAPVVMFKRGPKRPVSTRKRSVSPTTDAPPPSSAAGPSSTVIRPTKKSLANPLVQGSKRRRDLSSTDGDVNGGGLEDLDYTASDTLTFKGDQYATRGNDHDTDIYGEITHTSEKKRLRLTEDGDLTDGKLIDDGQYRGMANYLPTMTKSREVLDKKMASGPVRATASVRTITLVDYQPDVCKDYKETGFCGYGDSCKFMHDRGDYLAGWQLDKLDPDTGVPAVEEEEEDEVPFACLICRKEFKEPVVTKCGHYFCMSCAVTRFIKSPKCYACGASTDGTFSKAEKILAKLEEKNRRRREEKGLEEESGAGIEFGGATDEEDGDDGEHGEEGNVEARGEDQSGQEDEADEEE